MQLCKGAQKGKTGAKGARAACIRRAAGAMPARAAGTMRAAMYRRRLAALVAAATVVLLCLCAPFAGCGKAEEERAQYSIEAVYEEGVVRARMRVEAESNGELRFNLYGNAYREGAAYPPVAAAYQKSAY